MTPPPMPRRLVLLGHPVAHSLSPVFQQAALDAAGIALRYELLDVAPGDLAAAIDALRAVGAAGNVTIPHKEAVQARCDVCSPLAARTGAVNTFWRDADGALCGDNTDVEGFDALADQVGVERRGAVIACLGSGGSAAAVCAAVERWPGATVRLWGRSVERTRALAERFGGVLQLAESVRAAVEGAHAVVNATPQGLGADDALPVAVEALPRDACVMDLVYRADETRWVRAARAAGHRAADGLEMLLQQGAVAFARWFGRAPDDAAMREALRRVTGRAL